MQMVIPTNFYGGFTSDDGDISAEPFRNNQGEIAVKSWAGLLEVISFFTGNGQPYWWRGQADARWRIESTATRQGLNDEQLNRQLLIFKKAGRAFIDPKMGDDEVLVLGRHHGLATPLLDFSETAYKALFFACKQDSKVKRCVTNDRALWLLDRVNFEGWNKDRELVSEIETYQHQNARLIAQDGLIIRIPVGRDLECIMNEYSHGDNEPVLFKITFPEGIREEALINLMHMGITYKTVYPDIDGAAMFANMAANVRGYQKFGVNVAD